MGGAEAVLAQAREAVRGRRLPLGGRAPEPPHLRRAGAGGRPGAPGGRLRAARLRLGERHLALGLPGRCHRAARGRLRDAGVDGSADMLAALSPEQVFDAIAIRVDGPRAWDVRLSIGVVLADTGDDLSAGPAQRGPRAPRRAGRRGRPGHPHRRAPPCPGSWPAAWRAPRSRVTGPSSSASWASSRRPTRTSPSSRPEAYARGGASSMRTADSASPPAACPMPGGAGSTWRGPGPRAVGEGEPSRWHRTAARRGADVPHERGHVTRPCCSASSTPRVNGWSDAPPTPTSTVLARGPLPREHRSDPGRHGDRQHRVCDDGYLGRPGRGLGRWGERGRCQRPRRSAGPSRGLVCTVRAMWMASLSRSTTSWSPPARPMSR